MSSETLQAIEQNIRQAKGMVEFGAALERLQANRDFRAVIQEGYLRDEAVRLVHLLADPQMQDGERQKALDTQLRSIAHLNQFFNATRQLAAMAQRSIASDEDMREELLAEELSNG